MRLNRIYRIGLSQKLLFLLRHQHLINYFRMKTRIFFLLAFLMLLQAQIHVFSRPTVLISYYSITGNTRQMADAIAEGANATGKVYVVLKSVGETTHADLLAADAIILGSPVYNANVAPAVQGFIASWPFEGAPLRNKIGAAFVTAGGISAGEELAQMSILHSMLIFGMIVVGGEDWKSPFGASAVVNEVPFQTQGLVGAQFLDKGRGLGRRVAHLTEMLHKNEK